MPSSPGTQEPRFSISRCREGRARMGGRQRLKERLLPNAVARNNGPPCPKESLMRLPSAATGTRRWLRLAASR